MLMAEKAIAIVFDVENLDVILLQSLHATINSTVLKLRGDYRLDAVFL